MTKIGMILDDIFPPDPRVENEAITLINSGHEVFLFCINDGTQKLKEVINGIQVIRYNFSKVTFKLSALSCDFPFYGLIAKSKINHFLGETNVSVIHIHDIRIAQAVFDLKLKKNISIVLDLHENRPEIMKFYPHLKKFPGNFLISPKRWKRKEEYFIKKSTKVIVVTEQSASEIVARTSINKQKVCVVPNSVRENFYKEAIIDDTIINKYKDHFVILYLGDTNVRRGLLTAIDATASLAKKIKNIKLVLVGTSSTDYMLKKRVSRLNINKFVDFEGWKDSKYFPSYISSSNVCISPLHRNQHHDTTYANKIFQYMSIGKPILASNAIAQKEIIERSKSGLVHEEKNVNDFCTKVLLLYHDISMTQKLGNNGKQFIENKFSWEITSQALVKLYEEL